MHWVEINTQQQIKSWAEKKQTKTKHGNGEWGGDNLCKKYFWVYCNIITYLKWQNITKCNVPETMDQEKHNDIKIYKPWTKMNLILLLLAYPNQGLPQQVLYFTGSKQCFGRGFYIGHPSWCSQKRHLTEKKEWSKLTLLCSQLFLWLQIAKAPFTRQLACGTSKFKFCLLKDQALKFYKS